MRTKIILTTLAAGLVGFAFAGTSCNQAAGKQISGLAVSSPDTKTGPTLGASFEIKWQPTSGYSTVSILLLKGPSTNVLPYSCIANSIPNSGSYTWSVPSSGITPQSTGYGIQIIADGSGDFQYSTQFGISGSSGSSSSSGGGGDVVAITSTTLLSGQKVTETIYHTSSTTTSSCSTTESSSSATAASSSHKILHTSLHHTTNRTTSAYPTAYATAYSSQATISASATGKNVTESVQPTITMSVPASLANVGGSGHAITTPVDVGGASSAVAAAPAGTSSAKAAGAGRAVAGGMGMGMVAGVVGVVAVLL